MLQIANIFTSIDGEVNHFGQGTFSTFIRLSGCKCFCSYCDTKWAQDPNFGKQMSEEEIVKQVLEIGCRKVTITGGEPLLQNIELLISLLAKDNILISVETSGTVYEFPQNYSLVDSWVVDYKIDNPPNNVWCYGQLKETDFVKILVWDKETYNESFIIMSHLKESGCQASFALSPLTDRLSHKQLVEWLLNDSVFDVKVNIQLHKFIWPIGNTNTFNGKEY